MDFVPEFTRPLSNPVLIFALLMALLFVVPEAAKKVKIPGIVGLIIAGAIVGPSALNLLTHDPDAMPPDFMGIMGTAGLMYLMFQAGLSLDLARFKELRGRSLSFGLISFFIPQTGSILIGYFVLDFTFPAALLLGSIIGSHTLIAFPIAAKLGLLKNTAVTMTLGGTLVTDTLSLTALAIVVALESGDATVGSWLLFATLVSLFVFLVLWGLPKVGYLFFRTVQNRPEIEFGFLLTVLFGTAFLAELVGLAPIIGAFVGGLAMNRLVPEQGTIMARVRFVGQAFFIPFFMIYVGLLIDIGMLFEGVDVWILAGILVALVAIGKMIAAKLVQRIYNYTPDEGWVSYGLSVPQAAATLAVTLVGFEIELFDSAVVNAVVLMILVSSILGTSIVEKFGRKVARQQERKPPEDGAAPERILVPVANPETSDDLLEMAFLMRDRDCEEPIYPLMVVPDGNETEEQIQLKQDRMKYAIERGAEAEVPVKPLTRIGMNVAHGIARAAQEEQASMIIIGWNGQVSARERLFGTVLDQLLAETRQMIFVNRFLQPVNTFGEVVVTIPPFAERSPGFFEAVHDLKLLASRLDADLRAICVDEHLEHEREFFDAAEPEMESEFEAIDDWTQLPDKLDDVVGDDTLVAALSARPKTAAWFPELDGLPRMVASRYPETSFSIVFLPEARRK